MGSSFDSLTIGAVGVTVTSAGASAATAIPNAADGNRARTVVVTAKATCYLKFGPSGVTCTGNDILLPASVPIVFNVKQFTHFAVLQETGATIVNVSPVER